jgi:hypothetical protein
MDNIDLNDNIRRSEVVDYFSFWRQFKETKTYKKLRIESTESLYTNVFFTEITFLFLSAIIGKPDVDSIRHQINILFFIYDILDDERLTLTRILRETNLDCFYSLPSNNFLKSHVYDDKLNKIVKKHPFKSWVLNENGEWEAPIKYPNDGKIYHWDEIKIKWVSFQS